MIQVSESYEIQVTVHLIPCICNKFKQSDIADIKCLCRMHQLQHEKTSINFLSFLVMPLIAEILFLPP